MSSSSSSDECFEPQANCNSSTERASPVLMKRKISRFTTAQKAFMNAYYNQGMKGTGKQYKHLIKAANDAGLTSAQVKVCITCVLVRILKCC